MNDDLGIELANKLGTSAKFWNTDVLSTDSITAAVNGAAEWISETGKPMGGVIAAAGVAAPALVSLFIHPYTHRSKIFHQNGLSSDTDIDDGQARKPPEPRDV